MDIYFMDRHSVDKVGIKKANLKSYPDTQLVGSCHVLKIVHLCVV